MADPVSAGISALSSLAGAVGSIAGGNSKSAIADQNAAIAQQNAGIALAQGGVEADQARRASELTVGKVIANAGAAGVDPNSGSVAAVREQDAGQGELNAQDKLYNARLQALGFQTEASQDTFLANQYQTAGHVGAGTTLLSGAGGIGKAAGVTNLTNFLGF